VAPVVVSIYDDDAHLFDAIAAGAQGYLLKDEGAEVLVGRLREIASGEPPLSPSIARRILAHFHRPAEACNWSRREVLTPRETEVLALLGRGLRIGDAAQSLGLTRHTVAGYVKIIYSKLNISSRAEAALEAKRRGLV
jgi:DNA-binding NarL/FixJ family response regulator